MFPARDLSLSCATPSPPSNRADVCRKTGCWMRWLQPASWNVHSPMPDQTQRHARQQSATLSPQCCVSTAANPSEPNRFSLRPLLAQLESLAPSQPLRLSVHEGFAYYALHPLKVVDLLQDVFAGPPLEAIVPGGSHFAVLGIRSIGATLSAVLVAALRKSGCAAERTTVRPSGHPYDRKLALDGQQLAWIEAHHRAEFMVIDEGPGLSGSSFLAVAEASTPPVCRRTKSC